MSDRRSGQAELVDVLIITALKDEYDAVLQVEDGALPGSSWETRQGPIGLDVTFRSFQAADGTPLRVAVTRPLAMGSEATANAASPLVHVYQPQCLAMSGICAGRKGDVEQGDVIIASRVWAYDTGKVTVDDSSGQRVERLQGEVLSYNLPAAWLQKAETFMPPPGSPWLSQRPRTYASQMDWMLEVISGGEDPGQHPERKVRCPDYTKVLELLWKKKWLRKGSLILADQGRRTSRD